MQGKESKAQGELSGWSIGFVKNRYADESRPNQTNEAKAKAFLVDSKKSLG